MANVARFERPTKILVFVEIEMNSEWWSHTHLQTTTTSFVDGIDRLFHWFKQITQITPRLECEANKNMNLHVIVVWAARHPFRSPLKFESQTKKLNRLDRLSVRIRLFSLQTQHTRTHIVCVKSKTLYLNGVATRYDRLEFHFIHK